MSESEFEPGEGRKNPSPDFSLTLEITLSRKGRGKESAKLVIIYFHAESSEFQRWPFSSVASALIR